MKALLVNPPAYKKFSMTRQGRCSCPAVPGIRMEFPIFLAYMASILRQAGHSVVVIDGLAEDLSLDSIRKKMTMINPDAVIVETVPMTFPGDKRIAEIAKQLNKEIITIYCGWHATASPSDVLMDGNIDFVLRGEPEYSALDLLNTIENRGELKTVKGLSFKKNGNLEHSPSRPFIENLDDLPLPARDLFKIDKYVAEPFGKITAILASKGCPYSCVFCLTNLMNGKKFRSRTPTSIVDEIENIVYELGIKTLFFYSDEFTLWGENNIMRFCREILERRLDIKYVINSRIDTLPSENTLRFMAKSGLYLIQFGVESGSPEMIRTMKKGRTIEECQDYNKIIEPAIKRVKKAGIFTKTNLLLGFPGENEKTVNQSVDLVKKCSPDMASTFTVVMPYFGTELAREMQMQGLALWNWERESIDPKILKLKRMGDEALKLSLSKKLRLVLNLISRRDSDVLLNILRLVGHNKMRAFLHYWQTYEYA